MLISAVTAKMNTVLNSVYNRRNSWKSRNEKNTKSASREVAK